MKCAPFQSPSTRRPRREFCSLKWLSERLPFDRVVIRNAAEVGTHARSGVLVAPERREIHEADRNDADAAETKIGRDRAVGFRSLAGITRGAARRGALRQRECGRLRHRVGRGQCGRNSSRGARKHRNDRGGGSHLTGAGVITGRAGTCCWLRRESLFQQLLLCFMDCWSDCSCFCCSASVAFSCEISSA